MAKTTGTFLFLGLMLVAVACSDGGSTAAPSSSAGPGVAFVSERDGNAEIYVVNADGTGVSRLTKDPADDLAPAWSPDGTEIAFVSTRDGSEEVRGDRRARVRRRSAVRTARR